MCFRETDGTVSSLSSPHLPVQSVQGQARLSRCALKHFCIRVSETWLSKTCFKNATNPFRINQIQLERASNQPRNLFCGLNVSFEKSCKKWYFSRTENIFVIYQKVHFSNWKKKWFIEMIQILHWSWKTHNLKLEMNSFSTWNNKILSCKYTIMLEIHNISLKYIIVVRNT